ncbi:MAG: tRNA (cytidine(34)-2'-O)-methyltransferase [Acidobacteria bacterium]|nr:tRNA (cytidine(34)-2'-O)-methyltransferase [Acidobacteriota bacterium]
MFHIILHQPEIPQNTGSIGRLCVSNGARLHLVHPLGFDAGEAAVRRAGLDYWERLNPTHYADWDDLLARNPARRLWFFSTKGRRIHTEVPFAAGDGLVFGRETVGLPPEILEGNADRLVRIPMLGDFHRSLNLAQAAAVALYEALRQTQGW